MFDEEVEERFVKSYPQFCCNGKPLSPFWDLWEAGTEFGYNKCLEEAKELIKNIIRVTWGEGWSYSLDWKVKAEQFLEE